MEQHKKETLLPRREVERRVGHSCSWIYDQISKGTFPAPIRLSGTSSVRWIESQVDGYIAAQIAQGQQSKQTGGASAAEGSAAGGFSVALGAARHETVNRQRTVSRSKHRA